MNLKEQGLERVDLVTSDDYGGLTKIIRKHFCGVGWQHCQTHFSKDLLDNTLKKLQPELKAALTDLEKGPGLCEVSTRNNYLIENYEEEVRKVVVPPDIRFDEITAVYSVPEPCRKRPRTSNSNGRLSEGVRRRERVI